MTDYRDGKWYEWGGGDCPVCEMDVVEVVLRDRREESGDMLGYGGDWEWGHKQGGCDIVVFRVVKREPREFYAVDYGDYFGSLYPTEKDAKDTQILSGAYPIIKLKEVLD